MNENMIMNIFSSISDLVILARSYKAIAFTLFYRDPLWNVYLFLHRWIFWSVLVSSLHPIEYPMAMCFDVLSH